MKHIKVVAAIIQHEDKFLCVKRGVSKYDYISCKYEFPGGKIESGESAEVALRREIDEELSMDITVLDKLMTNVHAYPDFTIEMTSFLCSTKSIDLELKEHTEAQWLTRDELVNPDWAAADIPIVEKLRA